MVRSKLIIAGLIRVKNGVSSTVPCTASTPCRFSSIQMWSSVLLATCVAFSISIFLVLRVWSFKLFLDFPRFAPVLFAVSFFHALQFLVGLGRVFPFFHLALPLGYSFCFSGFFLHVLDFGFGETLPAEIYAMLFASGIDTGNVRVF